MICKHPMTWINVDDLFKVFAEMGGNIDPLYGDIRMSIADLAFWMRDKCIEADIASKRTVRWYSELCEIMGHETDGCLVLATPEQWIKAAVTAWKGSEK